MTGLRDNEPGTRTTQVRQRVCAALSCRRRSGLIPTKSFVPGVLVEIDLCPEHEAEHAAEVHRIFREQTGVDFVDPERN